MMTATLCAPSGSGLVPPANFCEYSATWTKYEHLFRNKKDYFRLVFLQCRYGIRNLLTWIHAPKRNCIKRVDVVEKTLLHIRSGMIYYRYEPKTRPSLKAGLRIRILILIKVMGICEHWSVDPPGLHFEPPDPHLWASSALLGHVLVFWSLKILNFDFEAIWILTVEPIRIQLFSHTRIQFPKVMHNADPCGSESAPQPG